jgi:hypothetical protein
VSAKSYLASVSIKPDRSLDDVVNALRPVLTGFSIQKDESGRFEEYPAFTGQNGGAELQLVGNPEGESDDQADFSLTVRFLNAELAEVGERLGSDFIATVPAQLPMEQNGYVNLSSNLSIYLENNSDLRCRPAWLPEAVSS